MRKYVVGSVAIVVAAALVLLTTYLALFYAPLPQTGVRGAGEMLSDVEGTEVEVAGFISAIYVNTSSSAVFALADFTDYQRFLVALSAGALDSEWWTVTPIDVSVDLSGEGLAMALGVNATVQGTVVAESVGNHSAVTGYSLYCDSSEAVETGVSPLELDIMAAPVAQKIFYFHMPAAWVSYVAFFVTLLASVLFLRSRDLRYDSYALSAAEIGVVFATIAILTGPIWAKEEWGVYWRWDDTKLLTTFILWLVYIGYLSLRAAVSDASSRARVSAVYGIIGFVTVPMSFLSSRIAPLLRSGHPQVIATSDGGLSPEAGMTVGIAVIAFTVLFVAILMMRTEVAETERELEELKREVGGE